jgi:short-subunit dehydrogenase
MGTNVTATLVHPGVVHTNINLNSPEFVTQEEKEKANKSFNKIPGISAEKAGRLIVGAIQKKKKRLIIGTEAKIISFMTRVFYNSYPSVVALMAKIYNIDYILNYQYITIWPHTYIRVTRGHISST